MSKLLILSPQEQHRFDVSPIFKASDRMAFFALDTEILKAVRQFRTPTTKVGFVLQLGYFKSTGKFFDPSQFRRYDINYVARSLGIQSSAVDFSSYQKQTITHHREKILALQGWKSFDRGQEKIKEHIAWFTEQQSLPKQIFLSAVDFGFLHKIEIPSYNALALMITDAYNQIESRLVMKLERNLTPTHEEKLNILLGIGAGSKKKYMERTPITLLKQLRQSMQPSEIQEAVEDFKIFKRYFHDFESIMKELKISDQATEYFATWVQKASIFQLNQFVNKNKLYLYVLCYIKHQFYVRHDLLIDIFLKSVQKEKNAANTCLNKQESANRSQRNKAIKTLSSCHKDSQGVINKITEIVKSPTPPSSEMKLTLIERLLDDYHKGHKKADNKQLKQFEDSLDTITKNHSYFDALESLSLKLQRKVSFLIKTVEFDPLTSDFTLLKAINHFVASNGEVKNNPPLSFLKKEEKDVIYKNGKLRVSLYKIFLYCHMADKIKSGHLNLLYSYRYRAIDDYLIDQHTWQANKEALLENAGLLEFMDFNKTIDSLKEQLDTKYQTINERFLADQNPHLTLNEKNKIKISTPKIESDTTEYISSVLSQVGYVPIVKILRDVNEITEFVTAFKHFSTKHKKMNPLPSTIFAGIMGKGCNIGLGKLAHTSVGISEDSLKNTVNWFFTLKNIQEANNKILNVTHKLFLANSYRHKEQDLHTGSDGRKVNVKGDSLHASHSYKYFGKGKGVSLYLFLDERHLLFYSTVISSSEREAAYVIDGLLQNEVLKSSIHSTDTHGFTESVFAITHFINTSFAPRIKNIGDQNIYAFTSKKTYKKKGYKILPSRSINLKLMENDWDSLLRFMVTIKLQHTSASQLLKRGISSEQ